jgi:hydrogenase maturation protease
MPTARQNAQRLVIGCGNLLRGDDAAGPLVVRRLRDRLRPADLCCLDAGTAGLDAAFAMRGAAEVTIVDACRSGAEPGTILELSADDLDDIQSSVGLSIHDLRWSDALALGRLLPGEDAPASLRIWLVEGATFETGGPLTPAVDQAVDALVERLLAGPGPTACGPLRAASTAEPAACSDATAGA